LTYYQNLLTLYRKTCWKIFEKVSSVKYETIRFIKQNLQNYQKLNLWIRYCQKQIIKKNKKITTYLKTSVNQNVINQFTKYLNHV